jgi:phospholipase/lecithinase/hemolysin
MRPFKLAVAVLSTALLFGCGGDNKTPQFNSLVSFGDSLSDVGTYAVGTVKALGGGKYTVNGPDAKNWIELMAARLNLSAPCPAQTGLNGDPAQGLAVPVMNFSDCTAYGQGGARVNNPVGPGNKALGGANATLGQLTVPVVTQIQNHLTARGGFSGSEIVFVFAGSNDLFINVAEVAAGGDALAAVKTMATAGADLAGYIKNLIVGKGAKYVVVVNVPDISKTPFAMAQNADTQTLISAMATAFNLELQAGLVGADVLLIDAYAVSRDQNANPSKYGITNTTMPACDLSPAKNPLGSSLICTKANVIAGNIDNFLFADTVHPTPYGYKLLADLVSAKLTERGWQ